jgi:hypothetical protein
MNELWVGGSFILGAAVGVAAGKQYVYNIMNRFTNYANKVTNGEFVAMIHHVTDTLNNNQKGK